MKNALAIAKKELNIYFVTPLAYVGFTLFVIIGSYFFLRLLTAYQQASLMYMQSPQVLNRLNFQAAIFRALKELDARGHPVDFSTLGALTEDDPVAADLVPLVLMHEPERAEGEATDAFLEEAESCLTTLRLMSYDRRIKELAAEIAAADRAGEEARRDELVMEDLELKRRRTTLLPQTRGVTPGGTSSY